MELKKYQKQVIGDLRSYLSCLKQTDSLSRAYRDYWELKQVPVGAGGIPAYQNIIDQVPHVCYKVPTGGGKTLIACASVKPIIDALPAGKHKAVVWLVPSDSILTQTLAALKNPNHMYRRQLNLDFASRVEVYSKDELLAGQNFTPATVAEQLSVMVLSYDSFRSTNKEGRKASQANGALATFKTVLGSPDAPIAGIDETALFQVINQLEPVVIVDESHHARSELSKEMLRNFNPSFVLDLTATPKQESNIISYVDALALKVEHMVKLPVVVYNKPSRTDVISDAIDIRRALERAAITAQETGGEYIRPIVLFQAQPKVAEDATSFEMLRAKLVEAGVPEGQIAIKTANVNEVKNVDLLSPECPIRFIITVNALKEGWDCPFAYVLASLANKTSQVDVEQILGRILRQPHTRRQANQLLNTSYVLTSSSNFQATIDNVIKGLNSAGFTQRDYRVAEQLPAGELEEPASPVSAPQPLPIDDADAAGEDDEKLLALDSSQLASKFSPQSAGKVPSAVEEMLKSAEQLGDDYERKAKHALATVSDNDLPTELENNVPHHCITPNHAEQASALRLPQFYRTGNGLLGDTFPELVSPASLTEGFTLKGRDSTIDLSHALEKITRVDVTENNADSPKAFLMNSRLQQELRKHFDSLPIESRKREATGMLVAELDKKYNTITSQDLTDYVRGVVENFDNAQLNRVETSQTTVANRIKEKIDGFLDEYRMREFSNGIDDGSITVQPRYVLPAKITLSEPSTSIGGSLYAAEGKMGGDERDLIMKIAALDNVLWWHRVIVRAPGAFFINGPLNHYPDFLVCTESGKIIAVEPKGGHLKNEDSRRKLQLGKTWAMTAGGMYRYYMVFNDNVQPLEGAHTVSDFLSQIAKL